MTERHAPISPRFLTGLIVLGFGVLILLSNLGFADLREAAAWWPVGLVAVGILKVVFARSGPAMLGGTLWAGVGLWILLYNLHIIKLSFWTAIGLFWPVGADRVRPVDHVPPRDRRDAVRRPRLSPRRMARCRS